MSKLLQNYEFQKSKGQAEKALIESKKARLAYRKERGDLVNISINTTKMNGQCGDRTHDIRVTSTTL